MLIAVRQINADQLSAFISTSFSGSALSGALQPYFQASGWLGNSVVYASGGAQSILGTKTFDVSPVVPYSGATGTAPSTKYVLDQDLSLSGALTGRLGDSTTSLNSLSGFTTGMSGAINFYMTGAVNSASGVLNSKITSLSGFVNGASGALSAVRVTGSSTIPIVNMTGLGGTLIIYSGGTTFISGAAAGGGLDTSFSGYVENNFVHRNLSEPVTGVKTFVSEFRPEGGIKTPARFVGVSNYSIVSGDFVVIATGSVGNNTGILPSSVDYSGNLFIIKNSKTIGYQLSGVIDGETNPTILPNDAVMLYAYSGKWNYIRQTGILASGGGGGGATTNNYYITGTGVVTAYSTGTVTNTFNVTSGNIYPSSSGTVTNTFNGPNNITISQATGNFVNLSYYFDEYALATGLNQVESMIGRSFTFTGYALGVINTGTQGYLSGSFYQRTSTNTKTNFLNFSLNSGVLFAANGGFNQEITGLNRFGLDIYLIGTGITGLSIGAFGVGF